MIQQHQPEHRELPPTAFHPSEAVKVLGSSFDEAAQTHRVRVVDNHDELEITATRMRDYIE